MKKFIGLFILMLMTKFVCAETGVVVEKFGSCDHFIADGPKGLYVLEWLGGHDPIERETIVGNLNDYGIKMVQYPNSDSEGRIWVADLSESYESALRIIRKHCQ
ncbi:hypothetical protein AOC19_04200 [Polynucleobacter asymbioticus]|uniref:hypothetical protein n=1 Tax=Polynucleobacter asymbioticus TaxID=576611 RepID=UPI001BFDA638|nr:hypothetical protein [Polynucleobacter asymbioticus]QWD86067.1 hypothetical protein AOC19_04200 [Polynucleobacter asymbioticus]